MEAINSMIAAAVPVIFLDDLPGAKSGFHVLGAVAGMERHGDVFLWWLDHVTDESGRAYRVSRGIADVSTRFRDLAIAEHGSTIAEAIQALCRWNGWVLRARAPKIKDMNGDLTRAAVDELIAQGLSEFGEHFVPGAASWDLSWKISSGLWAADLRLAS
jgi:hypothetical protein